MSGDAGAWAAVIAGCIVLCSCTRAADPSAPSEHSSLLSNDVASNDGIGNDREDEEEREAFDEDRAKDTAEAEVSGESYTSIGAPYGCTEDCGGHEAGFRFRSDNGYAGYNADSPSFNEGGRAFDEAVDERVDEMRSDYENGEQTDY